MRPWRLVRAFVGASLTLLAIGLIAPATARAGCEHPADRPGIGLDAVEQPHGPATADQAPRPKPCSGPSCSNKPAPSPGPTSAPQPPPRAELWGLVDSPPAVDPPGASARVARGPIGRPVRYATPVFHPPRLPR